MDKLFKGEINNPLTLKAEILDTITGLYNTYTKNKELGLKNDFKLYEPLFDKLKLRYGILSDDFRDIDILMNKLNSLSPKNLSDMLTDLNLAKTAMNTSVNESKNMKKIQNKELLSEELKRFRMLTDYDYYVGKNQVSETFPVVASEDRPGDPKDLNMILGMNEAEGDENLEADASGIEADLGLTDEPKPETTDVDVTDAPAPEGGEDINIDATEEPVPAIDTPEPDMGGDEVELDVTELVKGSEAAKASADSANSKIEQLMGMVDKLESQLQGMSTISNKIEDLEKEIERRNPTPVEKLEMRSLDSFPYNVKLSDFWAEKGDRYDTGAEPKEPTEYVLTQQDIDDSYSESDIEDSFDEEIN
jgi:hypothetical protein